MDWEQLFCPNRHCSADAWMVRQGGSARDLWWVANEPDSSPYTVAATVPVCPRCGDTLLAMLELEGGLGGGAILEEGPMFAFVRTLAWDGPRR